MDTDPIQQASHDLPLAFIPLCLSWHHRPSDRQHPRMHQQSQIDNGEAILKGCIVQDEVELLPTERSQDLGQKELPDQRDHNAFIGNEAS